MNKLLTLIFIMSLSFVQAQTPIDIIRASTVIKNNSISGNNIYPFLINKKNFTIDYPDDLKEISLLLKRQAIKIKMI